MVTTEAIESVMDIDNDWSIEEQWNESCDEEYQELEYNDWCSQWNN